MNSLIRLSLFLVVTSLLSINLTAKSKRGVPQGNYNEIIQSNVSKNCSEAKARIEFNCIYGKHKEASKITNSMLENIALVTYNVCYKTNYKSIDDVNDIRNHLNHLINDVIPEIYSKPSSSKEFECACEKSMNLPCKFYMKNENPNPIVDPNYESSVDDSDYTE